MNISAKLRSREERLLVGIKIRENAAQRLDYRFYSARVIAVVVVLTKFHRNVSWKLNNAKT